MMMDTGATVKNLIKNGVDKHIKKLNGLRSDFTSYPLFSNLRPVDFDEIYESFIGVQQGRLQLTLDTFLREKFLDFVDDVTPELIVYC